MTEFDRKLQYYHKTVESSLEGFLPGSEEAPRSLLDAMAYSLLGGGKRIRAVLLLAFYEYCGGTDVKSALPFAAAVEMIHAYSLIHDDLPCMDDDDLRRGKPSCHIVYGEATALLAGDALLTLAFETAAASGQAGLFGADKIVEAVRILSSASGASGMVGGQVMDLANEGVPVSADELRRTDSKKTGALIRAAAEIGCVLAGADSGQREAALAYAGHLGLAFQVIDDILDQTSDEATLGKPVGSDAEREKSTYVSAYGLQRAGEIARELTGLSIGELRRVGGENAFLIELVNYLCNRTC